MNTNAKFIEHQFYHVFNRTNNKENLFKRPGNHSFFLARYKKYLFPFVKTHAYALLGNHYHFSIQIRSINEISKHILSSYQEKWTVAMSNLINQKGSREELLDKLIINQFQNFQVSYAKSINKQNGRNGSLFQNKFKRSIFDPDFKFRYLQYYIHHNARKHRLVKNFDDHPFNSYHEIIEGCSHLIDLEGVFIHFQDLDSFKRFHHSNHFEEMFSAIHIED